MAITKIEVPELFDFGSDNSAFKLPTGTTAERPTSPSNGEMRFNTTTGYVEYYDTTDTQWWEIDYEALCTTNDPNYPITNLAYYKMSNASDSSGNGYNGTATDVNFNVQGKFGNAGEFNGTSSKITVEDSSANAFGFANMTGSISVWLNPAVLGTQMGIAAKRDQGSPGNRQWIFRKYSDNKINFYAYQTDTNSQVVISTSTIPENSWTHVVVTLTTSEMKIYLNGVLDKTTATSYTTIQNDGADLTIGVQGANASSNYWNGSIDQIRIFNSALNASQVTQLYEEIQCVPTIVPSDNFNTVLYTGDSTARTISTGFAPDLVWIKNRNNSTNSTHDHSLFDSVRTTGYRVRSNSSGAANDYSSHMSGFTSGGFNLTTSGALNDGGGGGTYVAWNWKAGGAAVSNTDGTITSQVSANVDAGFSIVSYTGNSTIPSTVAHGLDSAPELIMVKVLNQSYPWNVFSASIGNTKYLKLNETSAAATQISRWNNTSPTSAVFTIGNDGDVNGNGLNYIAYAFHSVDGFSKIGSYVGNGSATGPTIVTGFEPAFLLVKKTSSAGASWVMLDNKRSTGNPRDDRQLADQALADGSGTPVNFYSNGFQPANTSGGSNTSGATYIFMAFAADPT